VPLQFQPWLTPPPLTLAVPWLAVIVFVIFLGNTAPSLSFSFASSQ
jgi:hypothetical protein